MVEWGSGFSTIYFSQYVKRLISIDSLYKWSIYLQNYLRNHQITNVELYTIDISKSESSNYEHSLYEDIIRVLDIPKVDIVFIDGMRRNKCGLVILPYITKDTKVFMDDWEKYLSKSPLNTTENTNPLLEYYDVIPIENSKMVQLQLKEGK